jgi:hypothetical protein
VVSKSRQVSRHVQPGDICETVTGPEPHGGEFLADAIARGAVVAISDRPTESGTLVVDNARKALGPSASSLQGQSFSMLDPERWPCVILTRAPVTRAAGARPTSAPRGAARPIACPRLLLWQVTAVFTESSAAELGRVVKRRRDRPTGSTHPETEPIAHPGRR